MKKLFVGSLPTDVSEDAMQTLFSEYGKVRSIQLIRDVFTGKCRGFGFVEMEGHEARAAIAGLDGKMYCGQPLKVRFEEARGKNRGARRR